MHVIAGLEVRVLSALRGRCRREVDFFVCFFRHCARLLRRHPGRTCTAACLRARKDGVVAGICQTIKTSPSALICSQDMKRSYPQAVLQAEVSPPINV